MRFTQVIGRDICTSASAPVPPLKHIYSVPLFHRPKGVLLVALVVLCKDWHTLNRFMTQPVAWTTYFVNSFEKVSVWWFLWTFGVLSEICTYAVCKKKTGAIVTTLIFIRIVSFQVPKTLGPFSSGHHVMRKALYSLHITSWHIERMKRFLVGCHILWYVLTTSSG